MIKNDTQFDGMEGMDDMQNFAAEISAVKNLQSIKPSHKLQERILNALEPVTPTLAARFTMKGRPETAFSGFFTSMRRWTVLVPIGAVAVLTLVVLARRPDSGFKTASNEMVSQDQAGSDQRTLDATGDSAGQPQTLSAKQAAPMAAGGAASTFNSSANDNESIDSIADSIASDEETSDASITQDEDANTKAAMSDDQTFTDYEGAYDPNGI
jgi:hypothetical protein